MKNIPIQAFVGIIGAIIGWVFGFIIGLIYWKINGIY